MAQRLAAFPLSRSNAVYDWPTWADGSVWRLTRGEDFSVDPHRMQVNAYAWAQRHSMECQTRTQGDTVTLQFRPAAEDDVVTVVTT